MIKTCEMCDTPLLFGRVHQLFCSEECLRKFFDEKVHTVECPTCHMDFDTWADWPDGMTYCSEACRLEGGK